MDNEADILFCAPRKLVIYVTEVSFDIFPNLFSNENHLRYHVIYVTEKIPWKFRGVSIVFLGWSCAVVLIHAGSLSYNHHISGNQAWWKKFSFSLLTDWGRVKMAAIFRTTFSDALSCMKMYEFRLRFHWNLFVRIYLVTEWVLYLTHWGRVTHICVGKLIIIGSDNGLPPERRQAIIWTHAGLLSIGPLRTYFSKNLIKIQQFSLKKMHVKMSSAKWRPSCLGLNVLICKITNNFVMHLAIWTLIFWSMMNTSRGQHFRMYSTVKSLI